MTARIDHCNVCRSTRSDTVIVKDGFDLAACRDCGLLYVRNPPTDAERAEHYSFGTGYHSELGDDPQSMARHEHEARCNLASLQRHARSGRLLDIGCSTGLFLKQAQESGWPGTGLEYSADSARIARETYGLTVQTGELRPETYAPDSFDVVTMWDVIEHVPDPRATLSAIAQILATGGILALKTPNADGLYPRASLRLAHRLGFWGHPEPPGHLYQFSVSTLSRLVRDTGFDVFAVQHGRIPINYSFGSPRAWFRSAKWFLYCAAFLPTALVGPWIGQGDDMVLFARRR